MKSPKVRNLSTDPKNKVRETYQIVIGLFGLKIDEEISLFELMTKICSQGYNIYEILGKSFNANIEVFKEAVSSKWKERFFKHLITDDTKSEADFEYLVKMISEKFIVKKIDIMEEHIYIKGHTVDQNLTDESGMPFDVGYPILAIKY